MCNVFCCLKVHIHLGKFFRLKILLMITVKCKSWKHQDGLSFSNFMDLKEQNLRFCSSNVAWQQYWSSEKNCLELV